MDIQQSMQQAPEMQKRMLQLQEELGRQEISLSVGGGMVTVTMSGHKRVLALKIDPEALSAGVDMVEDLIVAALNHAARQGGRACQPPHQGNMAGFSSPPA